MMKETGSVDYSFDSVAELESTAGHWTFFEQLWCLSKHKLMCSVKLYEGRFSTCTYTAYHPINEGTTTTQTG